MRSICFVSPRFPPYIGGVETHVSELAKRAASHFRDVSVITTDPRGGLPSLQEENGFRIYRLRSFAPHENYHFPSPAAMLRCLKACNPEILHLHSIHDIPGPMAGLINGNLLLITPHFVGRVNSGLARIVFSAYRLILGELMEKANHIICMSRFEANLVSNSFSASRKKIRVIPNGVDSALLARYTWSEPAVPGIVYAGRLERYKNVDKLIHAFNELRTQEPELRLRIVGSGPARLELMNLAGNLALDGCVEWSEGIDKNALYKIFSESTVLVVPSEFENFSIVAAEAISMGVPTIVANSSALSEFVEIGLAMGVNTPITSEGLRVALGKILENPKSFSFRSRASQLVHSWDQVAQETFALYDSLN